MKRLSAYLKDTTQFLCEMAENPVKADTWLVTIDVKSLYINIPNDQGIQACNEAWLERVHGPTASTGRSLEIFAGIGTLNTFEFDEKKNSAWPWAPNWLPPTSTHS